MQTPQNDALERTGLVRDRDDTLMREMLASAPVHVARYGNDGRCRFSNPSYARWFGLETGQVVGMSLLEIVGDAAHAEILPYVQRALRGERVRYTRSYRKPDGRACATEVVLTPRRAADGGIDGYFAFLSDVTDRMLAEAATRRSDELKAATLAAALDAIVSLDHEGIVIEFNPAAERCFGYARESVIGRPMVELLIPPALRERHREGFKRYLQTRERRVLGKRLFLPALRSDGTQIEIELAIIRLPDVEPPVFTAFARDVTDVTRAQDIARRSQERLERALESSQLALFEVHVETGRVYLSEGWAKMIGAPAGETHTSIAELLDLVHPDERDTIWSHAMDAMSGRTQGYDIEHRVRCPDGRWIWIMSRSRVVERDSAGRTVRMSGTNVDITERKHAEQRLHYLATRDALTDLCNRALFGDRLERAIEDASRHGNRVALISIGLDRFTTINDSLGQSVGDTILKRVAERLIAAAGSGATVARPGGDEFLVLLPQIESARDAADAADRLHAEISRPVEVVDRELVVTASIGIALYPDDADTSGLLLRNADIALHSAKDTGRDHAQFFADRMDVAARSRLDTEAEIRQGLERDEFIVHYQPQVDLATGVIVGFEALVRWQHPQRGLVGPDEFLPVAESTGLIVALGERVLRTACQHASQWQRRMRLPVPVAVNVTARQFRHRGFVEAVRNALATAHLAPGLLELEIIENAIMEHGPDTVANLDAISAMGVQLAIDDFGTGYSSLGYLKRLPVDTVKIDRSFVADLPGAEDANAIVGAIIALAHNLGLKVVAEGVETRAQCTSLRDHGCDRAQGFFFGRPAPPERLSIADNDTFAFASAARSA